MICYKCTKRIVLHAFSQGSCSMCGDKVVSTQTPANKLCKNCATVHNELCECCGNKIIEFKDEDIKKEIIDEVGVKLTHIKTGLSYYCDRYKPVGTYEDCSPSVLIRWNENKAKSKLYAMLKNLES